MKILILISLISVAIALPKPGIIKEVKIVERPISENIDDQVRIVGSEINEEAVPLAVSEEEATVVIAPEEPFERIVPLNDDVIGNNEVEESNDLKFVQESEVSEQVQVVDAPLPSDDVDTKIQMERLNNIRQKVLNILGNRINGDDVQVVDINPDVTELQDDNSEVIVVQEPENNHVEGETIEEVQVENSQISEIAQDNNIASDVTQELPETVQVVDLTNVRDQVLALINKIKTIKSNNAENEAVVVVEPEVAEFHDQVNVVDMPILSEIAVDDNIIDFDPQEIVQVVDEPILLSNHIINHGFETVNVVNNPFFDVFQSHQVQQQVIIVGSPSEIVDAVNKIIKHVQVANTPTFINPPRIFKFPNPLLR